MSPLVLVAVAVAGGLGAGLRYAIDIGVRRLLRGAFPWGTLVVNVTGSFAIGLVMSTITDGELAWVISAGLLGGYTTFSTVALETWLLGEEGEHRAAWLNALVSVVACAAAAAIGMLLGAAL